MILWSASLRGAKAVPGDYTVKLTHNGVEQTQAFNILRSPVAESSVAEMQTQFEFVNEVNQTIDKAHKAIKKIRSVNKKLNEFQSAFKDNEDAAELRMKAKELVTSLGDIEKALYQTQNRSNQDPLNFPIRLTNKLGHINNLVMRDDFPPTAQDVVVKNELTEAINKQLTAYEKLMSEDVDAFNTAFKELKLDYLLD
jgi:uncharacterized coiled-coil DUF342 family protein